MALVALRTNKLRSVLTLLGIAALQTSDDEVSIAGNEMQEMKAFYAAEAGLEQAAATLQEEYEATNAPPTTMPAGNDTINNCVVAYSTTDDGAPTTRELTQGTLAGLHALVKSFSINSTGVVPAISLMSAPAAKNRSVPVITIHPLESSASMTANAPMSSSISGPVKELNARGWFSRTNPTPGAGFSTRIFS